MIEITHYKPINKNSLIGSFSIKIAKWGNFCIRELSYFKKEDGQRWVSFPSKQYEKDGQKKYFAYNAFAEENTNKAFQEKVLEALDAYLKANNLLTTDSREREFDEIPF